MTDTWKIRNLPLFCCVKATGIAVTEGDVEMPVLKNASGKGGKDPFFDAGCIEFAELIQSGKERGAFPNSYFAEHLCEGARSLIYQNPRVTQEQANRLIDLFQQARQVILEGQYEKDADKGFAATYAEHIGARIQNLKDLKTDEELLRA